MKEIKFRAWYRHGDDKRMFYDIIIDEDGIPTHRDCPHAYYLDFPMQYTGLKDKNGKEIYEGDVVSAAGRFGGQYKLNAVWYQPMAGFSFMNEENHLFWDDIKEAEVIGNIYENPELLEKK